MLVADLLASRRKASEAAVCYWPRCDRNLLDVLQRDLELATGGLFLGVMHSAGSTSAVRDFLGMGNLDGSAQGNVLLDDTSRCLHLVHDGV